MGAQPRELIQKGEEKKKAEEKVFTEGISTEREEWGCLPEATPAILTNFISLLLVLVRTEKLLAYSLLPHVSRVFFFRFSFFSMYV